jgi:hypothetical protein
MNLENELLLCVEQMEACIHKMRDINVQLPETYGINLLEEHAQLTEHLANIKSRLEGRVVSWEENFDVRR